MFQSKNFFVKVKNESLTNSMIMLILLCYPAILLTVNGGMGVLYFLLLLISLVCLYRMRTLLAVTHWDKYSIAFALAMSSPILAIFLSQAYHGNFDSPSYDWASRFLLCVPIFLALRQTDIRTITVLQFGISFGTLIGFVLLILNPYIWVVNVVNHATTSQAFNLIHFSDSALILGLLSLFSINWAKRDHLFTLILKICAFLAGVYMSAQSGERGGWIAIPPLLFLWFFARTRKISALKLIMAALLIICATYLSYSKIDMVHYRVEAVFSDLNAYSHGNHDSSIGIRLQLWHAAFNLFISNPLFGLGPDGFVQALPVLYANGMLTPAAAAMGNAEVHNEILAKCVGTGIFGLLSILSVFLVPLVIFWHSTKSTVSPIKIAGFMGICLVLGFFIFGLTVEIFDLKMTAAFFSLTLAVLMAAATNKSAH